MSKKWSHLTFGVKERPRFSSDASVDSSVSMSSRYVSLSTISVDLKLFQSVHLAFHFRVISTVRSENKGRCETLEGERSREETRIESLRRRIQYVVQTCCDDITRTHRPGDNGFRVLNECAREFVPYCLNLWKNDQEVESGEVQCLSWPDSCLSLHMVDRH